MRTVLTDSPRAATLLPLVADQSKSLNAYQCYFSTIEILLFFNTCNYLFTVLILDKVFFACLLVTFKLFLFIFISIFVLAILVHLVKTELK